PLYNGTADLDIFDKWTYEVDTWGELHGLDDALMLKLIAQFLMGKASQFFMRHVAICQSDWTHSEQGKRETVRDFVRTIEHLTARFPDVTDMQLVHIFWEGIHLHIRVHLIKKGFNPETTKLSRLVKHMVRKE
ncbi:hypothetical protein K466DRAFT_457148, partial [Polyporus arcularius HHB13444]